MDSAEHVEFPGVRAIAAARQLRMSNSRAGAAPCDFRLKSRPQREQITVATVQVRSAGAIAVETSAARDGNATVGAASPQALALQRACAASQSAASVASDRTPSLRLDSST